MPPRERLNRAGFVSIAADVADALGLESLSITKVARAAGISTPGAYKHVTDVADLRRGIAMQTVRDVADLVRAAGAGRSGADALAAVGLGLLDWGRRHPGRYSALQTTVAEDDEEYSALSGELVATLAATMRGYELSDEAAVDAVRLMRSVLHGFIMLELAGGFQLGRSVDASFERAIRALDPVFRSWADGGMIGE